MGLAVVGSVQLCDEVVLQGAGAVAVEHDGERQEEGNQEDEAESEEDGPKITADDYLEDDVDPAVIAALFAEDDEIVRPSGKRKAPKERKLSESSDSSVEEEARNQKRRDDNTKRKKDVAKAKADVNVNVKIEVKIEGTVR